MLHEKITNLLSKNFKEPLVETLAMRWQDRCVEVRDAAQALLLAELSRIGVEGRKKLVEVWAGYLPNQDPFVQPSTPATAQGPLGTTPVTTPSREEEEEEEEEEQEPSLKPSPSEYKRKQTTAIILLGVLGAEFGEELTGGGGSRESKKGVEGFGVANSNLARLTSEYFSVLGLSRSLHSQTLVLP
jgi:hypothetical protein